MAKSDLQSAVQKWQSRAAQAQAAHVPDAAWKPLMQKDFASIMQGHSPMADAEVNDAIRSAVGQSPIKDPSKGTSPLDIIGNIPSDIQNVVTGFIPGIVGYVEDLPSQAADLPSFLSGDPATLKKYGLSGGITDLPSALRELAAVPVISPLIPGIHTLAGLTTSAGRQSLEQHPVSTVLDVGAAAAAGGQLGLFGSEAAASEEAAAASAAETAKTPLEELKLQVPEKTATSALQKGQPYRALGRTALKAAEEVSGGRLSRAKIEEFLFNHAAHPILREWISRPYDRINTLLEMEHHEFLGKEMMQSLDSLSEEDKNLLNEAGRMGNPALLEGRPDLQALDNAARDWIESMARQHPLLRQIISPWGRTFTYTRSSPVVRAFDAAEQAATDLTAAQIKVRHATAAYEEAVSKHPTTPGWHKDVQAASKTLKDETANLEDAQKLVESTHKVYNNILAQHAPAAFYPFLDTKLREQASDFARLKYADNEAKLNVALGKIRNATTTKQIGRAIGDQAKAQQLMEEVERTWVGFSKDQGVDPMYLPNIHESKVEHLLNPTIFPDVRYARGFITRKSAFNLSRTNYDFTIGLTGYHQQLLMERGQAMFVNNYIKHFVIDSSILHDDLVKSMGGPSMVDVRRQVEAEKGRNWVEFDPEVYGMKGYFPKARGDQLMIPVGVKRALDWMGISKKHPIGPVQAVKDKTMNIWRFSVLSAPRHVSHISLGGMMMGTLQDPMFGPKFVLHYNKIKAILNNDDKWLKAKFGHNFQHFSTDQFHSTGTGKSLGRINVSLFKHPFDALNRWEERVTTMYKINAMLINQKKGLGIDEAIAMSNKWFVDRSSMLPIERVSFNKIFPFYGFSRHLFRYLMTYPSDHPYVTSILMHFANQHEQDWNSGLARNLSFLFFLGVPDENGNVSAVDYRSIDPFRSFYNDFTLAGFWSQVNPGLQFLAQASGLNILSGTQELYPNIHYDPNTGQMVADRPNNLLLQGLEQLIPETTAAEAYFGLSDQYRNLKISDPAAYRRRILTALGIPFWPQTFNVDISEQTAQTKRYRDAQTAISKALQTGDFSSAKRYDYVPVPSLLTPYLPSGMRYITPQQAEYVYNALRQQMGAAADQASLHALLPKPTRTRTG